jgi:hypothetical protein
MPGDGNLDGRVDINDLTIVLTDYGQTGMEWGRGDFNNDGTVDVNDLTIVLTNYNQSLSSSDAGVAAVPEPSAMLLILFGTVGLFALARRWRKNFAPASRGA